MELTKQITFFMGLFAGGVGTALWFLVANSYHGKNDEETKPKQTNSTENNNKKALESTEQITARNDESICSDLSSTKNTNDQEEKATQTTRNKRTVSLICINENVNKKFNLIEKCVYYNFRG